MYEMDFKKIGFYVTKVLKEGTVEAYEIGGNKHLNARVHNFSYKNDCPKPGAILDVNTTAPLAQAKILELGLIPNQFQKDLEVMKAASAAAPKRSSLGGKQSKTL